MIEYSGTVTETIENLLSDNIRNLLLLYSIEFKSLLSKCDQKS